MGKSRSGEQHSETVEKALGFKSENLDFSLIYLLLAEYLLESLILSEPQLPLTTNGNNSSFCPSSAWASHQDQVSDEYVNSQQRT